MQHCRMAFTIPVTKRGSLTLPPSLRRKMGLDKMRNPMLLVEEREGGLFLQPAVALPIRDIPKKQIEAWIARDEVEMATHRTLTPKTKKKCRFLDANDASARRDYSELDEGAGFFGLAVTSGSLASAFAPSASSPRQCGCNGGKLPRSRGR